MKILSCCFPSIFPLFSFFVRSTIEGSMRSGDQNKKKNIDSEWKNEIVIDDV